MTADFTPDPLAARLAAVHARLAGAHDTSDILAIFAEAVAPYGPCHADLRYLAVDEHGQPDSIQVIAVWQESGLQPTHPLLGMRLPITGSIVSQHWMARPDDLLAIPDVTVDDRCDEPLRRAIAPRRGFALLPLHSPHQGGWHGAIILLWLEPHTPGAEELLVYRTLLHTVAAMVASRRSTVAFEAALAEARALYRVSARIVEAASPADLLAVITDLALSADAVQGTLLLVEDDSLLVAAAHAATPDLRPPTGIRHPLSALPAHALWQTDPDAPLTLDEHDIQRSPLFAATDQRAVLLLPLRWQGRAIAYVHLGWHAPHRFSDAERRLFRGLARQAAAVLDNRLLWDRTQRAIADNRNQQQTFEALLYNLPIGVTVIDRDGYRRRMNRVGLEIHDLTPDAILADHPPELRTFHLGTDRRITRDERLSVRAMTSGQIVTGDVEVERRDGTRSIVAGTAAPSRDEHGEIVGCVLLFQDITDRIASERDKARMHAAILAAQAAALAERATPIIPITADILVMPIVGTIDPERGRQIQSSLLAMGGHTNTRAAILDLTGVPTLDEHGAAALVATARALRLRGVLPILSGLRPDVAWTLVSLDIELSELCIETDLRSALARAIRIQR